jgi:hypothetical protein
MTTQYQCINPKGAFKPRTNNLMDQDGHWLYLEIGNVDEALVASYDAMTDSFAKHTAGDVVAGEAAVYDAGGKLRVSTASPAAAGSTVANATALTAQLNYVTAANGAKGVVLPVAAAGESVEIINSVTTAGNYLNVYAVTGSQINALGSTVAFVLQPGQRALFIGRSATLWNTAAASDTISGLTATASELNVLHTATPVTAEINSLTGQAAAATMTSTPATGSCAVQLTLKDSAGAQLSHAVSGIGYVSTVNGLAIAAATSVAVLTNGALTQLAAGAVFHFVTTATGLLGITLTDAAATNYYITLQMPNGKLVTTGAIVVN